MNSNYIQVGSKRIGDGHPIYIMADLGLTNGGDLSRTFELIDVASEMGVDAVKFQMIGPEHLLGDKAVEYTYTTLTGEKITENMYEMFLKLSFSVEEWHKIAEYTKSKGLEFICTAHYFEAVAILEEIGVNIHKICTWSATHKRLVQEIGKTGKPLMLDTGVFTTASLLETLGWHADAGGKGSLILHDFHTEVTTDMNFNSIPFIKKQFGSPVGYTPQGRDFDKDFMSIGMGVNILEKRLTVDNTIPENGHFKALNPNEFNDWLQRVRVLESSLGFSTVLPTKQDFKDSERYFKSLYINRDVQENTVITDEMLSARRPGIGISAKYVDEVIGKRTNRNLQAETMLDWSDLN
ncbi:N-acetylneuraminate synthase family protein [Thiomicrorhabdus lithotrophica]|uniref:N-acetylneuraminate synthase family protein n=1 Tax=Thiomicrorhabdus lithotrophica TaxID=2949997 RepID=A0ABY8CF61_9GAMM|nr:N-acetylneuraminate synthase family protein [Thiomicrorhabdus lithotrophica]WEJ63136.1 N-acetylneuraminate synthase family protein [Thiomicrorhabdus lithotrophica]